MKSTISLTEASVKNNPTKQPFFVMSADQIKLDYKARLITAETYIYYLIKAHRSAGWKWTFTVKEFCQEWEIKERTFYQAVSKLKAKKLIEWQAEGRITVWWGSDIAKPDSSVLPNSANPDPVCSPQTFAEPVQHLAVKMQGFAEPVQDVALELHTFAEKTSETLTKQEFQNATDIKHIITDQEEEERLNAKEEMPLSDEHLQNYLEAAKQGVKPPQRVIEQFRSSAGYWANFVPLARQYGWDIKTTSHVSEILEQLRAKQKKH